MHNNPTLVDDEPSGAESQSIVGLVMTAILLIGCGVGLMMWDDHNEREQMPIAISSVP